MGVALDRMAVDAKVVVKTKARWRKATPARDLGAEGMREGRGCVRACLAVLCWLVAWQQLLELSPVSPCSSPVLHFCAEQRELSQQRQQRTVPRVFSLGEGVRGRQFGNSHRRGPQLSSPSTPPANQPAIGSRPRWITPINDEPFAVCNGLSNDWNKPRYKYNADAAGCSALRLLRRRFLLPIDLGEHGHESAMRAKGRSATGIAVVGSARYLRGCLRDAELAHVERLFGGEVEMLLGGVKGGGERA